MNKQKFLKIFIVLSIIFCVFTIFVFNMNYYNFTPQICKALTKQTPEEFCENEGKNTLLEKGYTYAKVNADGNLVLLLTDNQLYNWKNRMLDNPLRKRMKKAVDYKLSEDNTKFTAKCYRETAIDSSIACGACATESIFLQILDKKDYDSIKFEGFFIDAVTNETKYHLVFKPGKTFKTNFNAKKFSSIDDVE